MPFDRVTLGDQSVYEADVVGYDEDKDVAVLHIDCPEEKLRPLPVGSSSDLLVGQKVFAIGNPVSVNNHILGLMVGAGLKISQFDEAFYFTRLGPRFLSLLPGRCSGALSTLWF
jgi:S1-C subfamily serine protease